MANEQPLIENLPSTPDVGALQQMSNPLVVVTRVSAVGKKGSDKLVINGMTGINYKEILALQDQLPIGTVYQDSGPGLYKFEVTDQETTAKVRWQIRLGGTFDNPAPEPRIGAVSVPAPATPPPPARPIPPAPDAQNLGNGWVFNPALDLLTAPDGSMHTWRKGQPLPTISTSMSSSTVATATAFPATAFTGSSAPNPEFEAMRQTLAATQAALAEARDREKEAARQREIRELQERMERVTEENNKRFEALVARLTEAPKGNPELEEMKRRLEERERIDGLRSEMKTQLDGVISLVRESTSKGPDPMIGVLTQMLADQRRASEDNVKTMRDIMLQERGVAKENMLTPERLLAMLREQALLTKDNDKSDMMGKLLDGVDKIFERMSRLNQMEREISGSGGGVDWMSIIRDVGKQVGSAVQMFQMAKAREAQAAAAASQAETAKAAATAEVVRARSRAIPAPAAQAAQTAPAAAPAAVVPTSAPAKKPRVPVVEPSLSDATVPELRALFKAESDAQFFGPTFEFVEQLREEAAKPGVSSEDIAGYILQSRALVEDEAKKGNVPHAAELLIHGQIAYLLERLLPEASEGLRSEIAKEIKAQLQAEEDAERIAANRVEGAPAS